MTLLITTRKRRKLTIISLICLILFLILIYYSLSEDGVDFRWLIVPVITKQSARIACYDNTKTNTLRKLDETNIRIDKSIFFHETSCSSNYKEGIALSARQACAIESAAIQNPSMDVYILIASPVSYAGNKEAEHIKQLITYPNIFIRHVELKDYFRNTPLEKFYNTGRLKSSYWPESHASDLLRYLTLWKFGGIYLDLDIVLLRSLENMKDFAGAESEYDVAAGFISLSKGSHIADLCIRDLYYHFKGYDWGYNGPGVITRVLKTVCSVTLISEMSPERCDGFTVYKPHVFYPVSWEQWRDYFNETKYADTLAVLSDSVAIHLWNKFSFNYTVIIGSNQPYSLLASKNCPKVYSSVDEIF